ncbi:asparagine synthase C-terminal domain-containing protein [Methanorbis rubei]|uniref:Asparagine synthetase domain-containing protein n=1 Tax=Methanorbis rubei TaxID=3028300 RepID=A0AAE4MG06_9EURY|nr:hypothetical protein [Methanocorpusculaceae archaeon Cs1]
MEFRGWIERDGHILTRTEIESITPASLQKCGGEFFLRNDLFTARDCYGIMPAPVAEGVISFSDEELHIHPEVPDLSLEDAVCEAVRLRADNRGEAAVVTLSGGVDSTLIAVLADLPCIAVGLSDSHDLAAAADAADRLGLRLNVCEIAEDDIEEALPKLLSVLPSATAMDIEIGLAGYFIGRAAKNFGAEKILTGQAADELFGGYARYGRSPDLRSDLAKDFLELASQRARDAAAAGCFGVWYSMPYMDERVIKVSRKFSDDELVSGDQRKIALRKVAEKYLPKDIAWKHKKAMQYGTGTTAALKRIAKKNGCSDIGEYAKKIRSFHTDVF